MFSCVCISLSTTRYKMNPSAIRLVVILVSKPLVSSKLSGKRSKKASPNTAPAENEVIRWDLSLKYMANNPPANVDAAIESEIIMRVKFIHRF